jgi:methylglutaconyl-CoA hydratase
MKSLQLKYEGEIAILTLNRPDKRNAISGDMVTGIPAALSEVSSSPARVLILTGAGSSFCAGLDLETLRTIAYRTPTQHLEDSRLTARMFSAIYNFPKPLIAAVNGPAIAGGTGLATLADFTLAVPEATFGYTEAKIGFVPAVVSVFLLRQVGEKRTREMLLSARLFDAQEALHLGLVTRVVPAEKLMEEARALAESLLQLSPTSLRSTKWLVVQSNSGGIERDLQVAIREGADIRSTPDFREGLSAFLEKRKPNWTRLE